MTRDQLEAVIWEQSGDLTCCQNSRRAKAMDAILAAADQYATYIGGITAERRLALAEAVARKAATSC